jgi:purine nucleoside phosphorylase
MKKEEALMRKIEEEVAIAVGVANMIGVMEGKCTDNVIRARDSASDNIQKMVKRFIKKITPTTTK